MENVRGVFYSSYKGRKGLKKLNNLVSKQTNCKSFVECTEDKAIIYVPSDKYNEYLCVGKKFAKMYGIDVCWLNVKGEPRPLNYISLMYGLLPNESTNEVSLERITQSSLSDIELYIFYLEQYLVNKKVSHIYDKDNNAIEILIKASIEEYELVRQQCEGFNYTYRKNPFLKIMFLEYDGLLNRDDDTRIADNGETAHLLSRKPN